MTKHGYMAFDTAGYATRAYIATSLADARRAAEMEMGPSLGKLRKLPLAVVSFPAHDDRHLMPADLTTNYGWAELTPWE